MDKVQICSAPAGQTSLLSSFLWLRTKPLRLCWPAESSINLPLAKAGSWCALWFGVLSWRRRGLKTSEVSSLCFFVVVVVCFLGVFCCIVVVVFCLFV